MYKRFKKSVDKCSKMSYNGIVNLFYVWRNWFMATAGLVFGIIGLVFSFIPILNIIGLILTILGVIFSAVGIKDRNNRGKAITGLVLSLIALCVAFWYVIIFSAALSTL